MEAEFKYLLSNVQKNYISNIEDILSEKFLNYLSEELNTRISFLNRANILLDTYYFDTKNKDFMNEKSALRLRVEKMGNTNYILSFKGDKLEKNLRTNFSIRPEFEYMFSSAFFSKSYCDNQVFSAELLRKYSTPTVSEFLNKALKIIEQNYNQFIENNNFIIQDEFYDLITALIDSYISENQEQFSVNSQLAYSMEKYLLRNKCLYLLAATEVKREAVLLQFVKKTSFLKVEAALDHCWLKKKNLHSSLVFELELEFKEGDLSLLQDLAQVFEKYYSKVWLAETKTKLERALEL